MAKRVPVSQSEIDAPSEGLSIYDLALLKVGRKSTYSQSYCGIVIAAGMEGCSVAEMACRCDSVRKTLLVWAEKHPEFAEALEIAKEESLAWWEKEGRISLARPGFNASLYSRSMAARFASEGWREERSLVGKDGGDLIPKTKHDLSDAELLEIAARAGKSMKAPDPTKPGRRNK